jgi:hypothetical protein
MMDQYIRAWRGIQPGDIGFDEGGGIVGFLIRHFSHSPYAHCWVYHRQVPDNTETWMTAEAYPGGLKIRKREQTNVHRVIRVWRTEEERRALLARSDELVGSGYNYRELFRIVHYRLRKNLLWIAGALLVVLALRYWEGMDLQWLGWPLLVMGVYASLPLKTKLNPRRVICSNHVAQSVLAARDVELTYPPQSIWPGRLERDLNVLVWNDGTRSEDG